LLVTASVVLSSPILVTLMKETPSSSETSVFTRATWHNNPEDTILHSYRRENLKSYFMHSEWAALLIHSMEALGVSGSETSFHVHVLVSFF
jgi:hypothetical protein